MILMWLLQENSVHYKSIEGNAFWEAVLHFPAIPPRDVCSWWQIVYKAKTSVRASNSSITDHLENPQILCSFIKSSHYMSCGAVSTARALQLFPKSPGALLCVSRKFTSFTRESFSQSAALHFPLKYFLWKVSTEPGSFTSWMEIWTHRKSNSSQTPDRECGRVLAPGKCAHTPASPNTSGVWDRPVLMMLV